MTSAQVTKLVIAALFFIAGVVQYRRRAKDSSYGSQSAVMLFAAGAIFLVLGLGLLDYRPSPSELGQ